MLISLPHLSPRKYKGHSAANDDDVSNTGNTDMEEYYEEEEEESRILVRLILEHVLWTNGWCLNTFILVMSPCWSLCHTQKILRTSRWSLCWARQWTTSCNRWHGRCWRRTRYLVRLILQSLLWTNVWFLKTRSPCFILLWCNTREFIAKAIAFLMVILILLSLDKLQKIQVPWSGCQKSFMWVVSFISPEVNLTTITQILLHPLSTKGMKLLKMMTMAWQRPQAHPPQERKSIQSRNGIIFGIGCAYLRRLLQVAWQSFYGKLFFSGPIIF